MDNIEKNEYRKLQNSKYGYSGKNVIYRLARWFGLTVFAIVLSRIFCTDMEFNYAIAAEALAAIIGSIGAVTSTGISSAVSGKMNRRALRYNKEQAEINREFQEKQTELAREWQEKWYNKYSSPQAQVRQYIDAGLNPALMLQGGPSPGAVASTSAPSGSQASAPSQVMPDLSGILDSMQMIGDFYLRKKLTDAQIRNLDTDSSKKMQETENLKTNKELMEADIHLKYINADTLLVQQEVNKAQLREIDSRISNINMDTLFKKSSIDEVASRINLNEKQSELILSQIGLNEKQLDEISARINNLIADTKNKKTLNGLMILQKTTEQAKASLLEEQAETNRTERIGISYDNFVKYFKTINTRQTGLAEMPDGIVGSLYSILAGLASNVDNAVTGADKRYNQTRIIDEKDVKQ